jgi:hypothetical protein
MKRAAAGEVRPLPPLAAVPFYVAWAVFAFGPARDSTAGPATSRTRAVMRRLLIVTAAVHVGEAAFAFGLARRIRRSDQAPAWAASTFLWGGLSLIRLHRIEAAPTSDYSAFGLDPNAIVTASSSSN